MLRQCVLAAVLLVACVGLGSCSPGDPTMSQVNNLTDKPVRVELFTLEPTGEKKNYSTVMLASGGFFSFGAEPEEKLPGMRARFTLQDESADNAYNAVTLNIPDSGVRAYDLKLINGHLVARELPKGYKVDPTK